MKKYQQKSIIAVITGGVVFVAGCFVLLYFAAQQLTTQINTDAKYIIDHLDSAAQEGLFSQVGTHSFLPYETGFTCSNNNANYCAAVHLPWSKFFSNNHLLLIISLILTCLAGVSSALLVDARIAARRSTNQRIKKGLKKGSFYWTYQPIICLQTGKLIGCEVLARFEDKYGALFPDEFIPVIRKKTFNVGFYRGNDSHYA